jgi:hypothetical protein
MDKNTGGSAFPIFPETSGGHAAAFHGMTLRDYFAAKAMQGMFANPDDGHKMYEMSYADYVKEIARCAYLMADAMLKARK